MKLWRVTTTSLGQSDEEQLRALVKQLKAQLDESTAAQLDLQKLLGSAEATSSQLRDDVQRTKGLMVEKEGMLQARIADEEKVIGELKQSLDESRAAWQKEHQAVLDQERRLKEESLALQKAQAELAREHQAKEDESKRLSEAEAQADRLRAELAASLGSSSDREKQLMQQLESEKKKHIELKNQVFVSEAKFQKELANADEALRKQEAAARERERALSEVDEALRSKETILEGMQISLRSAETDLEAEHLLATSLQKQLDDAEKRLLLAQHKAKEKQDLLNQEDIALEGARKQLRAEAEKLTAIQQKLEDAEAKSSQMQAEILRLQEAMRKNEELLESQLADEEKIIGELKQSLDESRAAWQKEHFDVALTTKRLQDENVKRKRALEELERARKENEQLQLMLAKAEEKVHVAPVSKFDLDQTVAVCLCTSLHLSQKTNTPTVTEFVVIFSRSFSSNPMAKLKGHWWISVPPMRRMHLHSTVDFCPLTARLHCSYLFWLLCQTVLPNEFGTKLHRRFLSPLATGSGVGSVAERLVRP
jgi:hypothetical protein